MGDSGAKGMRRQSEIAPAGMHIALSKEEGDNSGADNSDHHDHKPTSLTS